MARQQTHDLLASVLGFDALDRGEGAAGAAQGMSELCAWLETMGIGQYGDAFDANESGTDLLQQVDDQLLKGHRRLDRRPHHTRTRPGGSKSGRPRARGGVCPRTTAL